MTHALECTNCQWQGQPDDLVEDKEFEPTSIDDFTHCPDCECEDFKEVHTEN